MNDEAIYTLAFVTVWGALLVAGGALYAVWVLIRSKWRNRR